MIKFVFPNKEKMWDFIDKYGINNGDKNNVTATFICMIQDVDAQKIMSAIVTFDASVNKV